MNIGRPLPCFFTFAHLKAVLTSYSTQSFSNNTFQPLLPKFAANLNRMITFYSEPNPELKPDEDTLVLEDGGYSLIVWNDDVNSFDWVIQTLMEIVGHSAEQAEQCALIIHMRGKYAVKHGGFEELKVMAEGITDRGINATVEAVAV